MKFSAFLVTDCIPGLVCVYASQAWTCYPSIPWIVPCIGATIVSLTCISALATTCY